MMSVQVVLSVGSNCRYSEVGKAMEWLGNILDSCRHSHEYLTPALQGYGDPYTNAVVAGVTSADYSEFETMLKRYERERGRDECARERGDVPIDIDIVIWDGEVVRPRDFRQDFFQTGYRALNEPVGVPQTVSLAVTNGA